MTNERVYYSHDAEMHAIRNRAMLTVLCLTFGLGIGAALALLFSPTRGSEVRHELGKGFEDGLHTGRDTVEPLLKRLEAEFADLRKSVDERLKHA